MGRTDGLLAPLKLPDFIRRSEIGLSRAFNAVCSLEIAHKLPKGTYGSDKVWEAYKALGVLILDPKTRAYLQANDPQALKQAEDAMMGA